MGFADKKETRQEAKERRAKENQDVKDEDDRIKEKLRKEAQAQLDKEARRPETIPQPKTPKAQPKTVDRDSKFVAQIRRENRESKKARESLEASKQKALRLIGDKESEILGSGIVFSNGNTKKSRTLAGKIQGQPEKICKGVFPLAIGEVSNGSSVSFISRGKVLAILTYTNRAKFVKINSLCSTGGRGGSKLFSALQGKFPSKQFRLDSVPTAVGFWKKKGFKVISKDGLTTKMIK